MGSSKHPLQQHRSGWSLCAIWDPCVAGDQKARSQIPGPTLGVPFWGASTINLLMLANCWIEKHNR